MADIGPGGSGAEPGVVTGGHAGLRGEVRLLLDERSLGLPREPRPVARAASRAS